MPPRLQLCLTACLCMLATVPAGAEAQAIPPPPPETPVPPPEAPAPPPVNAPSVNAPSNPPGPKANLAAPPVANAPPAAAIPPAPAPAPVPTAPIPTPQQPSFRGDFGAPPNYAPAPADTGTWHHVDTRPKPRWRICLNAGLTISGVEADNSAGGSPWGQPDTLSLTGYGVSVSPGVELRLGRVVALKGRLVVTASRFEGGETGTEVGSTLVVDTAGDVALRLGRPDGVFAGGPYVGVGLRHWDKAQLEGTRRGASGLEAQRVRTAGLSGAHAILGLQGRLRFGAFELDARLAVHVRARSGDDGTESDRDGSLQGVSGSLLPGYTF